MSEWLLSASAKDQCDCKSSVSKRTRSSSPKIEIGRNTFPSNNKDKKSTPIVIEPLPSYSITLEGKEVLLSKLFMEKTVLELGMYYYII